MKSVSLLTVSISLGLCQSVLAQHDKYNITPAEQIACQQDAATFCSYAYPDEDKLIACMKDNKAQLSQTCLKTFEAGLKRRHMS